MQPRRNLTPGFRSLVTVMLLATAYRCGSSEPGSGDGERCEQDERVAANQCVACPEGQINTPGDDPLGDDTDCDADNIELCGEDERVAANQCVACPEGQTNAPGDDPLGDDTDCTTGDGEGGATVVVGAYIEEPPNFSLVDPCEAGEVFAKASDQGELEIYYCSNFSPLSDIPGCDSQADPQCNPRWHISTNEQPVGSLTTPTGIYAWMYVAGNDVVFEVFVEILPRDSVNGSEVRCTVGQLGDSRLPPPLGRRVWTDLEEVAALDNVCVDANLNPLLPWDLRWNNATEEFELYSDGPTQFIPALTISID